MKKKVLILGAMGRDFHNFNMVFKDNKDYEVVGFTLSQLPIEGGRIYPPQLAGKLYPKGIPIWEEKNLPQLIKKYNIDIVVFAYSDVSHEEVMHLASISLSSGADFMLLGANSTMIKTHLPVIAVTAVRTGCGKSQTSRKVVRILKELEKKVVIVRHPMPYWGWKEVERFENYEDMEECTIEEREEFEPYIRMGVPIYQGIDYQKILQKIEKEGEIILWDGGNNDFPFYEPQLMMVVVDPLRVGNEYLYHPGESCLRMAHIVVINKIDTASESEVKKLKENVKRLNPYAEIVEAYSRIQVEDIKKIRNKKVLVIEDGPTLTHGNMPYGAGFIASKRYGAKEIVDPRPYAVRSIKEVYEKYTHLKNILPAMGYSKEQIEDLRETINKVECDTVVVGTPIDLKRIISIEKECVRVSYELEEKDKSLKELITSWLRKEGKWS
jgi:predicted GTPase